MAQQTFKAISDIYVTNSPTFSTSVMNKTHTVTVTHHCTIPCFHYGSNTALVQAKAASLYESPSYVRRTQYGQRNLAVDSFHCHYLKVSNHGDTMLANMVHRITLATIIQNKSGDKSRGTTPLAARSQVVNNASNTSL